MITITKEQIKKNIPLKKMADKTCPHCGSLTTFEYKDSRVFLCGSVLRKAIYGMNPRLIKSPQCDIIQDVKLRLMIMASAVDSNAISTRVNYLSSVEYHIIKSSGDEHKNFLRSHTNQDPT